MTAVAVSSPGVGHDAAEQKAVEPGCVPHKAGQHPRQPDTGRKHNSNGKLGVLRYLFADNLNAECRSNTGGRCAQHRVNIQQQPCRYARQ